MGVHPASGVCLAEGRGLWPVSLIWPIAGALALGRSLPTCRMDIGPDSPLLHVLRGNCFCDGRWGVGQGACWGQDVLGLRPCL